MSTATLSAILTAAALLSVGLRSVERLIANNKLRAVRVSNRTVRLRMADVMQFANGEGAASC